MKYGLIGEKLSHSFSKEIHLMLNEYDYELKEIKKEDLKEFMESKDFLGINVTIPYKEEVIKYLDEIDIFAEKIGAVNTVVNKNGKLIGYNTDFYGMKALLRKEKIDASGKKALILGTGGTSKTAKAVLNALGAKEIIKVSRNKTKDTESYETVKNHKDAKIIINTTPVGMYPKTDKSPLDLSIFDGLEGVIDVVYNPINTNLILQAKSQNIKSAGGLYMLCAQAVYSAELFLDKKYNEALILNIHNNIKNNKQNIVLVGMPGSGKSTIGKLLANEKTFVDTDGEIEKIIDVPIKDYILKNGEEAFRNVEQDVIKNLSDKNNLVIATGGGAVLKEENILNLKKNGLIVFLDAPLSRLLATSSRPLSDTKEKLEKLYSERIEIYNAVCDIKIDASKSIDETLEEVRGRTI